MQVLARQGGRHGILPNFIIVLSSHVALYGFILVAEDALSRIQEVQAGRGTVGKVPIASVKDRSTKQV